MNHKADDTFEEGIDDNFDERREDSITKKCDLNFIITGNDDLIKLPEFIRLLNSAPREPKMMHKRKKNLQHFGITKSPMITNMKNGC